MPGQHQAKATPKDEVKVGGVVRLETPSLVPHVVTAINDITAAFSTEGISKDRENKQQNFAFRGIDDVLNALSAKLADHKLVVIPHVQAREMTERQTRQGGALFNVVVRVTYTFISALDGTRETVGPFDGEAMDSADKATNKAMSAAYKYMAIQTFCIPTEGDNDADAHHHEIMVVRESAKPFIENATKLVRGSATLEVAEDAYKEVLAKPGYKALNTVERAEIEKQILFMRKALSVDD